MSKQIKYEDKLFWFELNNQVKIVPSKLYGFLSNRGFGKLMLSENDYVLVRIRGKLISEVREFRITNYIQSFLKRNELHNVYDVFVRGMSSYISKSKLELLRSIEYLPDLDEKSSSKFYFLYTFCEVTADRITGYLLEELKRPVWKNKLIKHFYRTTKDVETSFFEKFCYLVSKKDEDRFKSLKSLIGYLLHRYHDPTNARAIILVDENISGSEEANGGTGKGIIAQALGHCRDLVQMDGKNHISNSSFKFQRIERTTDIIFFDDVTRNFNLEELYSMITSGIQIEKKYQQQIHIPAEESPKVLVSSNYMVKGTGGSTDRRRRFEFELSSYFNDKHSPYDEFKHLFFNEWNRLEWNKFYLFMMQCVQTYLKEGLVIAKPINLKKNKLINDTCVEFTEFIQSNAEINQKIDKREFHYLFIEKYPNLGYISHHQFSKYLQSYATNFGYTYEAKASGGDYYFIFKTD